MCFSPSSPCSGPSGCMLMHWIAGFSSFSRRVTPMKVPLVPRPATKCVTRPSRLPPDLHRGRVVMGPPVGVVVVLVGVKVPVGVGIDELLHVALGAVGALGRVGQHQLGAVRQETLLALGAGVSREGELDAVAALGADHGVGDAGVAAGGVDQDLVLRQQPAPLAVQDHRHRRAVLDAAAGVVPLGLGKHLDAHAGLGHPAERQQRRVADQFENGPRLKPGLGRVGRSTRIPINPSGI